MALTISLSKGKFAPFHDMRIGEIPHNVAPELTHQNCVFIDKLKAFNYDIEYYTNAKFQPYIDDYNSKQTREERRKTKTYVEILKEENDKLIKKAEANKEVGKKTSVRKPTPIVVEYVAQFGNCETNGTSNPETDIEKNREAAELFLEKFQERYPHADIVYATFHADEPAGTPHLHFAVQFTGEGYKQGLEQQISISKALECDGFERKNVRGDYAIDRWLNDVKDNVMTDVLTEVFDVERDIIGEHREHIDTPIFREKAKQEALLLKHEYQKFDEYKTSETEKLMSGYEALEAKSNSVEERADEVNKVSAELQICRDSLTAEEEEFESFRKSEYDKLDNGHRQLETERQQVVKEALHDADKIAAEKIHDADKIAAEKIHQAEIEANRIKQQATVDAKDIKQAVINSVCSSSNINRLTQAFVKAYKPYFESFMDSHEELWANTPNLAPRGSHDGLSL